jgi:HK97 family phage major capsid protein
MSTDVLKIPAPELTSHATGPYGITAAWTAEGGNAVEQSPRLREIELKAMKLFFYAACTGELLSDAPNFDGVLRRMFSEAAAWHIDKALISGNGAGEPLGVLNAPCKLLVNRGTASQFRYVDAVGMLAKFAPNLGQPGIWLVHPTVVPYLHQLVVDTNIAHYALQTNQNGNLVLLGKEVFVTEKCRPLGTSGDVVLVNPAAIYFGSRSQWTIEATNAELFRRDMVSYRLIARLDSQISWNQALTLADGVNQVSPVVVLN